MVAHPGIPFYNLPSQTSLKKVKQIDVIEKSERIRICLKHFSDYYVNDEENDMFNNMIDYCYHIKAVSRTYEEVIKSKESVKWKVAMKKKKKKE